MDTARRAGRTGAEFRAAPNAGFDFFANGGSEEVVWEPPNE